MRTSSLIIFFFLASVGKTFLADHSIYISSPLLNKKIVVSLPAYNPVNTPMGKLPVDTAELKKSNWYSEVIKNIEESEYEIKYNEPTHNYASPNRKQNLRAFYTGDQFTLLPRNDSADKWKLNLQLKGIYTGKQKLYSVSDDPVATQNGNNIRFNHNNQFITEYINSNAGVRQNFIITQQPAGNPKNLQVELQANNGWFINKVHDKEIHFAKATKTGYDKKITYNSLKAWDASGKDLQAAFAVNKNTISIDVNTNNAVYPIIIDPLSTGTGGTPDWIADDANQAYANLGASVASAGDVNGDGYSDVIVGAWNYNMGQGRAFVYYGSASGLSGTPNNTLYPSSGFGTSVACAGDVNGDGYSDVIIGGNARVFAYYGSALGLSNTPNCVLSGTGDFGYCVASAGDVNGDGFSDVIIGTEQPTAYIYCGSSSGLTNIVNVVLTNAAHASFGFSLASAGDVNGDGFSDVIIGTPDWGEVFVYFGSAGGLSNSPNNILNSIPAGYFGWSVASAGDVNGDGYSDVIIGAPEFTDGANIREGRAYLYYGSSAGLSATPNSILDDADLAYALFGTSVASAGDVNGDGYSDVIIGAYGYTDGPNTSEGRAFIYYGSASGLSASPSCTPDDADQVFANFGYSVASAGDVNGDGYSDVIIGAPSYDVGANTDEGRAFVYHGGPTGLSTTNNWATESNQGGANYGISVASAGDVNSDGYSDVLVGAYIYDDGFTDNGKAYLYLGSATGLSATAAWTATGTMNAEYFGRCVASAGDVNGDGYADVLVGAYGYSNPESQEGRAYLFYGSVAGLSATAAWTTESNVAIGVMGVSLASAGDVNGDGYSDIIIGAPQYNNGNLNEGKVYVFYGAATVPAATADWSVESNQDGEFFGISVAGLGDVNGDGYCDIIIGGSLYDGGLTDEGGAFAYYGSAAGLSLTPNWTAKGNQANAQFGMCVAAAGDVNGDGYSDAIVGAYLYDNGQTDEGRAFVYYGSSTGLSIAANWTAESNLASSYYAYSVSSAGDVNGDGYSDVLIGARNYSNGQASEGALYAYYGSSSGLSATANWLVESNVANSLLGNCVAPAGDVNADGFSDVIGGAPYYTNPDFQEGGAFVYYGNNGTGLRNNLRLYNQDLVTPIQQSSIAPALFGAGLYAKSPLGRQKGKLVWETEKTGQPFSGAPITNSTAFLSQGSFTDLGITGTELKHLIAKEFNSRVTYIRARVKYDPVTAITGQVYGPWRYPESFLRGNRDMGAVALPVKIISFVALKQNENALLKWITADETAGIVYQVQHSIDGIHFETIKNITGIGNSRNEYEWLHSNPPTGKNFYRIRAVENGKEVFSVIRQLDFDKKIRVVIYPNPAKSGSQITVELTNNPATGPFYSDLFSIDGQKKISYLVASGGNRISLTLPELAAGTYILKLVKNGREIHPGSFVLVQ